MSESRRPYEGADSDDDAPEQLLGPQLGTEENRKVLNGNFHLWWLFGASFFAWFFLIKFPLDLPELIGRLPVGPVFTVHLVTSFLTCLFCVQNLFHTPSHGPAWKCTHVWVGRCGLTCSIVGALSGLWTAWEERAASVSLEMKIGLSVAGAAQLIATLFGWVVIRRYRALVGGGAPAVSLISEVRTHSADQEQLLEEVGKPSVAEMRNGEVSLQHGDGGEREDHHGLDGNGAGERDCVEMTNAAESEEREEEGDRPPVPFWNSPEALLRTHIGNMHGLFYNACLVPAVMRVVDWSVTQLGFGAPGSDSARFAGLAGLFGGIFAMQLIALRAAYAVREHRCV
mmetsp:Transcript_24366/g.47848  ORF Transcript_24366/g.47848 Transcript_24366/m.47848 type:complete len:341 (+) Transcript_24366:232-1254(+)